MRGLLGILLIAAFLPGVALAQENRPYVVMSGLFLALVESDENATSDEVGVSLEFEMDAGFGATLAFGYGANPGLSGEIEAGYRATQASGIENTEVNFPGSPTYALLQKIPVDADLNTLSLMANGYYTIDAKVFRPYVGAGIGLAQHKAKYPMLNLPTPVGPASVPGFSGDDVVFAYQFMLGLNWAFADNTEARAGYRYFATTEAKFGGVSVGYESHNIDAGLVIRF